MKINFNYLTKSILISLTIFCFSNHSFAKINIDYAHDPDTITVYTRNNYLKKDGPSKYFENLFYSKYKTKIHWINSDSSVDINHDLPNRSNIDVIMGMSSVEMDSLVANSKLMLIDSDNYPKTTMDQKHYNYKYYIPFESFQLSFIYDKEKIINPPTTLLGLITNPKYTIIMEDPMANNIGLDLLYWINDLYKSKVTTLLHTLYQHTILTNDLNTGYNKFTLGSGDFVLDYSSQPSVEKLFNKTSKYKALILKNGNIELHNYVAIVANTMKSDLAHDFINMLLSDNGQKIIAYKHYAYPIVEKDINLLNIMTEYKNKPIYINTEKFLRDIPMLKNTWNKNIK